MANHGPQLGRPGFNPVRKLSIMWDGVKYAVGTEFTVTYKVVLSAGALALASLMSQWEHVLIIVLATAQMVMAEMLNTAVEGLCDLFTEQSDERIRKVKDVAAAAVGITTLVWVVVFFAEVIRLGRQYFA